MNDYEQSRVANIARNRALLASLDLGLAAAPPSPPPLPKKRKLAQGPTAPCRASARLASAPARPPSYAEEEEEKEGQGPVVPARRLRKPEQENKRTGNVEEEEGEEAPAAATAPETARIVAGWTLWTPAAPPPTRSAADATFRFATHPAFLPNKSPAEILREGAFGGTYYRALRSRRLGVTVRDDWMELPAEWIEGLEPGRYLTAERYDAAVNKYGVGCGQTIEEWEAAGWIAHAWDVRGWFQWYTRFFRGRRCADDERQVARWQRCVGERGRWRRMLLKRYVALGVREVFDDGEDEEGRREVSPVVHQTCHHWAFELRQDVLDRFWEDEEAAGRGEQREEKKNNKNKNKKKKKNK